MDAMDSQVLTSALHHLARINRITAALSPAVEKDQVAGAIGVALTSPRGLGYSRAFIFAYDEQRECFLPDRALGAAGPDEAVRLAKQSEAERDYLENLLQSLAGDASLAALVEKLDAESLWIDAVQSLDAPGLVFEQWRELCIVPVGAGTGLFTRLAGEPLVVLCKEREDLEALPSPLGGILSLPFVAFSIFTAGGARAVVLADRAFQPDRAIAPEEISLLRWFRSFADLVWSDAETHAELASALERLREIDTLKNDFLATISHELRTPLTAVLGFLDILLDESKRLAAAERRDLLERTRRQADHLLGLVNDLLALAEHRIEGAKALPVGRVDPARPLNAAIARLRANPKWEKARIVAPGVGESPCRILADEQTLERIFYHLLENALKFGGPENEVRVRFQQVGDNCHLAVEDRGIGIERSQLHKIFSHFYQVDSRLSRGYPGMGIGLTLVKILLDATNGHILVESEPGKGSIFTVVYPRWEETAEG